MAIFLVRNVPLSNVFTFGSEEAPMSLIDITSNSDEGVAGISDFINSPGSFIYETRFVVNEEEALNSGVTGIRFEFFASKPNIDDIPLKENNFIISLTEKQAETFQESAMQKVAVYLKDESLIDLEKIASRIKAVSVQQPAASSPFKQSAISMERNQAQDPAQILSFGKVIGTTPQDILNFGLQGLQGLPEQTGRNFARIGANITENSISIRSIRAFSRERRNFEKNSLISDFLNLKEIEEPSSLVRELPVSIVEAVPQGKEYVRQLSFEKKSLLGYNRLYLRVSAIVRPGLPVKFQSKIYTISHSSEVKDLLSNPEPPAIISTESSFGRVSFTLKRLDPTLRRILVIRITKNPSFVNSLFENVGILEFGRNESIFFEELVDNVAPNIVMYRFVVLNDDGSNGEFSSSLLTSYAKVSSQKNAGYNTTPISIRALNRKGGIEIALDTINDQVYSVRLLRQDMGALGDFSDTITTILDTNGSYSQLVLGEKKTINFIDEDVITGRHYRYFAAYRLGSATEASLCREIISDEDETIVRYKPSDSLPFAASITPAFSFQDEQNAVTVQFDMVISEVEEQYNLLLDALLQAGISQQFISQLQNDKQKIKQVAAFLVERVDRVTGRRISFGIFAPGKFLDSPEIRSKLGIPDPVPGRTYEYICKLCIRPSNVFLLQATVGFTATNSSVGDITEVLAAKFQNALIGRGVLPSEKQMRDGLSIRENFFLGLTGLELPTSVSIPIFKPMIENVSVDQKKYYTLIRWSTSGDISNISYFLIYCNYNGTDELIGAISSVGKNSVYQYKDVRFCNEVGKKSYYVKFVTLEHDTTTESPRVEITTSFSVPPVILNGYVLIPSRNEVKGIVLQNSISPLVQAYESNDLPSSMREDKDLKEPLKIASSSGASQKDEADVDLGNSSIEEEKPPEVGLPGPTEQPPLE